VIVCPRFKKLSRMHFEFPKGDGKLTKDRRQQQSRADRGSPSVFTCPSKPHIQRVSFHRLHHSVSSSTFRDHQTTQRCLTSLTNRDCLREEGKQARDPALSLLLRHACTFLRYVLRRRPYLHSAPVARNMLRFGLIAFWTRSLSANHHSGLVARAYEGLLVNTCIYI
jgi:hypothetical protein